jgi:DNA-3-methyladenine glycosylase
VLVGDGCDQAGRRDRPQPVPVSTGKGERGDPAPCRSRQPRVRQFPTNHLVREFFARSVHDVAPALVGCTLLVDGVGGTIVEVEAYDVGDPASHGFRGETPRNRAMFGPPGHAYVYRSYGVHWCLNLVCAETGRAEAVLVRALEPTHGLERMAERRALADPRMLCSGPGRLCQALGVSGAHDGLPLDSAPFTLLPAGEEAQVVSGVRVGLTRAADLPWRYGLEGSHFLSRPLR